MRDPVDVHVLSRDGVGRDTQQHRDHNAEDAGEQAFDEGLGVEDLRDIVLGRTDRAENTDLFGPFQDRDVGDDRDHDARDDQGDGDERDQDIADGVDDLRDGRGDRRDEVSVSHLFGVIFDLRVVIVDELDDGLLPFKVGGIDGDHGGFVFRGISELLENGVIGVDTGAGELGHQSLEVLLAHHAPDGFGDHVLVLHDVILQHLLDLRLVHGAEIVLHHPREVFFRHIAHGCGDHVLDILLGHAADICPDHVLDVFLAEGTHGLLDEGRHILFAHLRGIVFDQLFEVRLREAAHELLGDLRLLLVGQTVEIALDEFPDHVLRDEVLEQFQEQVREGLEQEILDVGDEFGAGRVVRQKERHVRGVHIVLIEAERLDGRRLVDERHACREHALGEEDIVFLRGLLFFRELLAGQDIDFFVAELRFHDTGLRGGIQKVARQGGVVSDPAADIGVLICPQDAGDGQFDSVFQFRGDVLGVFGLVDIDVPGLTVEFGRREGAELEADRVLVVELVRLVFDLFALLGLFHHLVHVADVEHADGVEDIVGDVVVRIQDEGHFIFGRGPLAFDQFELLFPQFPVRDDLGPGGGQTAEVRAEVAEQFRVVDTGHVLDGQRGRADFDEPVLFVLPEDLRSQIVVVLDCRDVALQFAHIGIQILFEGLEVVGLQEFSRGTERTGDHVVGFKAVFFGRVLFWCGP